MALNTNMIQQATFQPVRFKPPEPVNALAETAQMMSNLQSLEANQMKMQQAQQQQAALEKMMAALDQAEAMGETDEGIRKYEAAFIQSRQPQFIELGMTMRQARMERARKKAEEDQQRADVARILGAGAAAPEAVAKTRPVLPPTVQPVAPSMTAETPMGEQVSLPTAPGAAPANAVAMPMAVQPQAMPVSRDLSEAPPVNALAPAAPVNAMVAPPVQVAGPTVMPRPNVSQLETQLEALQNKHDQLIALGTNAAKTAASQLMPQINSLTRRIEREGRTAALPADLQMMDALNLPRSAEGFAKFNELKQRPAAMSQLARLIEERDALPAGSPNRGLYDKAIDEKLGTEKRSIERQRMNLEQIRIDLDRARISNDQRRIAVLENQFMQQSDPAFQQRMAQAKAAGEAAGKGDAVAAAQLPKYIDKGAETIRLIDEMIGKAPKTDASGKVIERGTAPHPGFQGAVGATLLPGARLVPGTSEADFQARFEQIKGSAFLEAFEALKGGGAITEKEGEKGTQAITRMSLAQSEQEFITAARDLQNIVRAAVTNAQKKVRQGPASTGATTPSAPAAGVDRSNPLLQ